MAFNIVDFDQMTDSETSWLHSMSDYTMTCKSRDSVSRDVHKRVFAEQHDARKGTRMTRALRDKVEGMIDRDMQAEHAAYYIAACDPSQLLPAFANHREVLCEISSNSAEKGKYSTQECLFCKEDNVVCEHENANPTDDGFGGGGVKLNTGELVCEDCYNDACCEGVSDNFHYIEQTGIADYGDGATEP